MSITYTQSDNLDLIFTSDVYIQSNTLDLMFISDGYTQSDILDLKFTVSQEYLSLYPIIKY